MAKRRGKMPTRLFVGPSGGEPRRMPFAQVVLAVDAWDGEGIPVRFTRMQCEQDMAKRGNSDFISAYMPEWMMVPHDE